MSASSQYYSVTARVGVPHRHEVDVTVPLVGPAGATGPAGAAGASAWNDITGKPSTFAPSAHSSTHHTGGSDPITPANIGAAKDFTEIEVGNSGTSTTTLTTAQLPARVILFIDSDDAPTATINLPTPDARQSGLVASIKMQVEGGAADTVLITVVHNAVNLLSGYGLAEDEGSIDFRWDGYRWVYDANWLLRSSTGRVLELPTTSGTLALTENADSTFRIVGSSDGTKKVAFEVDGLSSGTTRTLTVPNASGTIVIGGAVTTSGLTQATDRILGRTTASTGAIEELSATSPLALSSGALKIDSGASVAGAALEADGSGSASFVAPRTVTKTKTADTGRTSTTTYADDDHLAGWTLDANSNYRIEFFLPFTSTTNGGLKALFYAPSYTPTSARNGAFVRENSSVVAVTTISATQVFLANVAVASTASSWAGSAYFRTGATGGTGALQWGQSTSSADTTTLKQGAFVSITKMS